MSDDALAVVLLLAAAVTFFSARRGRRLRLQEIAAEDRRRTEAQRAAAVAERRERAEKHPAPQHKLSDDPELAALERERIADMVRPREFYLEDDLRDALTPYTAVHYS